MTKTLIIAPPPTPNGDLHVGHMAGPYLAGDIYSRYLRMKGEYVNYATGTDDSQTYVVTSAHKLNTSPEKLCQQSADDICSSLKDWGVALDGYAPFDDEYKRMVYAFLTPLFNEGKIRLKTVKLPYSPRRETFMVESFVSGECPVCLAQSRGGLCENCGHPNNYDQLNEPMATLPPYEPLVYKETEILVFPVEEYRAELEQYYATKKGHWRPHILQLMDELFSRELIDFPITYPISWGLPSRFPGTEGQVINAWAEGMAASMYCNACGEKDLSPVDATWRAETGNRLVYFLGFDNSYFWGVTHLALLMAHDGKYILPESIVSNEFYELENAKFSTSRGHLIWARDLVRTLPRDYARFYLCLTSPEHNRSNFSRQALQQILNDRLIASWNTLVSEYNARNWAKYSDDATERTSTTIAAMHSRLELTCRIDTFSQSRLADWILHHITRLQELISGEKDISLNAFNRQLQVLVEGMGLIMIDLHRAITETGITDYNRQWGLPELLPINTFAESESYAS
ncbi:MULTISPECIES: class I tRNA ligase family protein [Klebsiella]|uniref:class I tRNA ligase family protein n=1 Tax=Klebsiella TaxID=570 RepID=UPI000C290A00|nr:MULTISPECIES: class I tRNA ligase family protein [Klebsiella]NKD42272.1 class I tRNA ligase family protein [Escherichia coli]MCH6141766.1 class I tRNA ligase family protein [Klebsiella variicola]MCH6176699.1 class I tRNA ligase family protein [Klebsiella variicola]MDR6246972.1 methionyl-tRNA synthetase [Klebsiella variicola]MDR6252508.1 methionyl-tRNA synthetase [Klebsiella variicola]